MIRLEQSGGTVASVTIDGKSHAVRVPCGCATCTAVGTVQALSINPGQAIDVRRDGKPAYSRGFILPLLAACTVAEVGEQGQCIHRMRPNERPHSGNSALRASDCPKDKQPASGRSGEVDW